MNRRKFFTASVGLLLLSMRKRDSNAVPFPAPPDFGRRTRGWVPLNRMDVAVIRKEDGSREYRYVHREWDAECVMVRVNYGLPKQEG